MPWARDDSRPNPFRRLWIRRVAFTMVCVALVFMSDWLISSERSPLHEYLLWHVAVRNVWFKVNQVPYLLGIALSGNVHQGSLAGSMLGLGVQWGMLGLLSSFLLVRARRTKVE